MNVAAATEVLVYSFRNGSRSLNVLEDGRSTLRDANAVLCLAQAQFTAAGLHADAEGKKETQEENKCLPHTTLLEWSRLCGTVYHYIIFSIMDVHVSAVITLLGQSTGRSRRPMPNEGASKEFRAKILWGIP